MIAQLFKRSDDYTTLAGKSVKIPKLTPAKIKQILTVVDRLPKLIASVVARMGEDDAIATLLVGVDMALEEASTIVAVLAELNPEYVEENADITEIVEFIRLTAERNDVGRLVENLRAISGSFRTAEK